MAETYSQERTYRVDYLCDKCGDPVEYSHTVGNNPKQFFHRCPTCSSEYWFTEIYPKIEHKKPNSYKSKLEQSDYANYHEAGLV